MLYIEIICIYKYIMFKILLEQLIIRQLPRTSLPNLWAVPLLDGIYKTLLLWRTFLYYFTYHPGLNKCYKD